MWTEQQYELAAKLAEAERAAALETVRARMQSPGSADGTCEDCGEQIGAARLAAMPSASRCIECQGIHEQRLRQGVR